MATNGVDIIINVNTGTTETPAWEAVAGQRNATLNRSAETIDITNKLSGSWKENMASWKEWSIDCDGLVVFDDAGFMALETAFNAGDEVEIQVAIDGTATYTGNAIISDLPIEAPYDDAATYAVTLVGTGALA